MRISRRGWLFAGACAPVLAGVGLLAAPSATQAADAPAAGQLTEESLGNLIEAMGLTAKKEEKRYDFNFKAVYQGNEWELSMSAVLSSNGESIWVMAWLDELPRSAGDVPRTALLRLLSLNDSLGQGKFFAYIASNRRFVLQQVIPNQDITTANFRAVLQDLGINVIETYPHWTVQNWKASDTTTSAGQANQNSKSGGTAARPAGVSRQVPTQSALRDPKAAAPARRN